MVTNGTEMCGLHGQVTGCQVIIPQMANPTLTLAGVLFRVQVSETQPRLVFTGRECTALQGHGKGQGVSGKGGHWGRQPIWARLPPLEAPPHSG